MSQKTSVARHACEFHFLVTSCHLILAFALLSMTFVLMQFLYLTYTSIFGDFELFEARLTDLVAQNVKMLSFDIWPDLCLTLDLQFRIRCIKPIFARLATTLSSWYNPGGAQLPDYHINMSTPQQSVALSWGPVNTGLNTRGAPYPNQSPPSIY